MPTPSIARNFFDQIRTGTDPVAFIQGLVNRAVPTYETDWLDFKQQPSANLKDTKWRDMWIEALAGFANNQGGVLIWGIDARKDPATNIDAACGDKPVDNPSGVKSRLIELQRQATDPPLANVEIDAYEIPSASGTGYVVCFVPEGLYKPYRAEDGRRAQYYVRSGDNFTVISRSMLQTMFYPCSLAVFRAKANLKWRLLDQVEQRVSGIGASDNAEITCTVELMNEGTATARNAQVLVKPENMHHLKTPVFNSEWGRAATSSGKGFETTRPLHPGWTRTLFMAEWYVKTTSSPATNFAVVPDCPAPAFTLSISCDDQERQVIKVQFDTEEMLAHREGCDTEASPGE